MIDITEATNSGLLIVQAIAYRTWPGTFGDILSPAQIRYMLDMMYSVDSLKRQVDEQNHVFLLARDEKLKDYFGFVSYELNYKGEPITKIHKLYLLPESQGKGVGRLLIDYVAELARQQNNNRLGLNVNRHNKAIQFYERMGFTTVGSETIDIGNGFIMDDLVMEKPLNPL